VNSFPRAEHMEFKDLAAQHLREAGVVGTGPGQVRAPQTWKLNAPLECSDLCVQLTTSTQALREPYMWKKARGSHGAHGVTFHGNGSGIVTELCGGKGTDGRWPTCAVKVGSNAVEIVQQYRRPALLRGRKFDIR
jgi:hypothetical protein